MGINRTVILYLPSILKGLGKSSWEGIKMLEFGNQLVRGKDLTSKQMFEGLGAKHVSIDMNGLDGALPFDLREEIKDIGEPFDVVTNFGTTEHIQGDQYQPFKTMHDLVKKDGIIISILPAGGFLKTHGHWRYSSDFFSELSKLNNYEVLCMENIVKEERNLIIFVGKKKSNNDFILKSTFEKIKGLKEI